MIILFNEDENTENIYTYNTALKNRLAEFSKGNPNCAKLITTYYSEKRHTKAKIRTGTQYKP